MHLPSRSFKENEATMLLALPSFNPSLLGRIELEESVGGSWDLTRIPPFVRQVGPDTTRHLPRLMLRIAESAQPFRTQFAQRFSAIITSGKPPKHGHSPQRFHAATTTFALTRSSSLVPLPSAKKLTPG